MTPIEGKQIIGFSQSGQGAEFFQSINPATGTSLPYHFVKATPEEVTLACEKASLAFQVYRKKSGIEKALFLEVIANGIRALGNHLIDICCLETALAKPRIEGERDRTVKQLHLFAHMLREGSWVDARIDTADPTRSPAPKPDLRYMHIGLGPVVVFGASNFPLAFSVAGGDTASAFAAGCPVIVKAHSAHPATSELVGKVILDAAKATKMPEGIFSMLHGEGSVIGIQLVKNRYVKAVGLTGSFTAGKALFDAAVQRDEPIPVYAEMGSTNPVFILPGAMQANAQKMAQGFAASVTLGVGQFCTNPGLLMYLENETAPEFVANLRTEFEPTLGGSMLTDTIYRAYSKGTARYAAHPGIQVLAQGSQTSGKNCAYPTLFKTTSDVLTNHPELSEEVFGPASVIVGVNARSEMLTLARNLTGHLTATVHGTEKDLADYQDLIDILEQKVGRIVINGFPTGVEVCHAMVHGGPYPATTDGRSTSVGTASIFRFTRAICYQNMPQAQLPTALKDDNPDGIWRLLNGERTKGTIV